MATDLHIAVDDAARLTWPHRCPRCGAFDDLVRRDGHVLRQSAPRRGPPDADGRATGPRVFKHAWLRVPIQTCRRHARANQLAGLLLLENDLASGARFAVVVGLLVLAVFTVVRVVPLAAQGPDAAIDAFGVLAREAPAVLAFMACGGLGAFALLWARFAVAAYPRRLERGADVSIGGKIATLRVRDDAFAHELARLNPKLAHIAPAPTWREALRGGPAAALALVLLFLVVVGIPLIFQFFSP